MHGCESGTVKKAERRRIDAFELWYWRRLLRVPWTARRSNQSILKDTSPGISMEGMMLKLKLQYFGHLIGKVDSFEKTLMLRGIGGRRRGWQNEVAGWHHWLDGHESEWTPGSWWWTGRPGVLRFMGSQIVGHDWVTELNWTELCQLEMNRCNMCFSESFFFLLFVNTEQYTSPTIVSVKCLSWGVR